MSCEDTLRISELIDDELSATERLAAVDHLLRCGECAGFYRQARALDAAVLLEAAAVLPAEPAPAAVWRRIDAAAGDALPRHSGAARASGLGSLPSWLLPVAAALLLVLGGTAGWQMATAQTAPPAAAGAAMDEERFVVIARELLAADDRYRDAMAGVLAVARSEQPREGSTAESAWRDEELRALRPERAVY